MGIIIISIILSLVFVYVTNKTNNDVIEAFSFPVAAFSIIVAAITGLMICINYFGKDIWKYEMQNRKERIVTLMGETESPFYATFKDSAMVFNNNMKSIKKYNDSFWLLGLQSFVSLDTIPLK